MGSLGKYHLFSKDSATASQHTVLTRITIGIAMDPLYSLYCADMPRGGAVAHDYNLQPGELHTKVETAGTLVY